tara:strand:- start:5030 stop:5305 length:276 start_codon:yes stop_codon:yes gene_type:complete
VKQHITEKQYNEIGRKKKMVWRKFMVSAGNAPDIDHLPDFPSIGQMIEFLQWKAHSEITMRFDGNGWKLWNYYKADLCNALWEAVKEVLEK